MAIWTCFACVLQVPGLGSSTASHRAKLATFKSRASKHQYVECYLAPASYGELDLFGMLFVSLSFGACFAKAVVIWGLGLL